MPKMPKKSCPSCQFLKERTYGEALAYAKERINYPSQIGIQPDPDPLDNFVSYFKMIADGNDAHPYTEEVPRWVENVLWESVDGGWFLTLRCAFVSGAHVKRWWEVPSVLDVTLSNGKLSTKETNHA